MPRAKFQVGEKVEVQCYHKRDGQPVRDWLRGVVVQTDVRMAAVQMDGEVYSNNGWLVADRILWCAHGSPNIRRPDAPGA